LKVAVCPVPGTFGRAVSTWFASIGRRSARCLAPVGRAVPGTCWPGGFSLFASIGRLVYPVPGTCCGGVVQPVLPALGGGLSGARHLLRRGVSGARHLLAGRFQPVCQHWTTVCPVLGTCWPGGGQRREKRLHRLATGGYRQVATIRCQAVDSGARTHPPSGDRWLPPTGGYPRTGGYRPDRWLSPGASIDALGANR
jgi:hypothetical protein